ncbi:MAG: pro-sigmaK processing inhibitor BofA family protein [Dethiobacteria bacterium]|jgi:inhibitor of the pro-sigma K processing machinery
MPDLNLNFIIAFFFGVLVLYILLRVFYFPLKIIGRFLTNSIIGGILLFLFNTVGAFWGVSIGINIVTAVITGILGIPGILLLLLLQRLTG